jgi:hypothetical protein
MSLMVIKDNREPITICFKHGNNDLTEPCAAGKNMVMLPTFDYSSSIYIDEVVKCTADECIVDVYEVASNAVKESTRYIFKSNNNGTTFLVDKHPISHKWWMNSIKCIPDMIRNPHNIEIHKYLPESRNPIYCTDRVMAANRMIIFVWLEGQWVRFEEEMELDREVMDEVNMVLNMFMITGSDNVHIVQDEFHTMFSGKTRSGKPNSWLQHMKMPPLINTQNLMDIIQRGRKYDISVSVTSPPS